jgi:hypothetical protein
METEFLGAHYTSFNAPLKDHGIKLKKGCGHTFFGLKLYLSL